MHLTQMSIGAIPPISERITLKFDERANVFVGPNASGKSTVLLILAYHFNPLDDMGKRSFKDFWTLERPDYDFEGYVEFMTEDAARLTVIAASEDWFVPFANLDERPEFLPIVVHIGSVRVGLPGISVAESADSRNHAAFRVLNEPFSGPQVQRALYALGNEAWSLGRGNSSHKAIRNFISAIETADACSMSICNEVIQDAKTHNYVLVSDLGDYFSNPVTNPENLRIMRGGAINTNDIRDFDILPDEERPGRLGNDESESIYLGHLSSGTEGTLLWIRWLAFKMVHHYDFMDGWESQPAVLLIDEIENHLHPTWQRRVIPALLEHFPGLQIFATTHSPFVVAGLKAGQVHLLNRDANGVITASTNTEDVVGWTADEILRTLMGVDDPTDDATAAAARELRRLRDEAPLDDAQEEEQRQAQIQELRQLVDRDLLAGGPQAAQRELFEQQFAEALEKYRQSRDLSQDNG